MTIKDLYALNKKPIITDTMLKNRKYCEKLKLTASLADISIIDLINKKENERILIEQRNDDDNIDIAFSSAECALNYKKYSSIITSTARLFEDYDNNSLDLNDFDTSNVTNMSVMFAECKAKSIDLSSFDTSNVTNMSFMFTRCEAESLDLSSFNTRNVKYMTDMFKLCHSVINCNNRRILKRYINREMSL